VRAIVLGSDGQLGRELVKLLGEGLAWAGDKDDIDVTAGPATSALISQIRPRVVFNATAWNRVDAAEDEPTEAFAVNAFGPLLLARACRRVGALLVHYSTDYVFDGTASKPYHEDDTPGPLSVYGASKLAGEHLVAAAAGEHLVIRTSAVLGRGGSLQKGGSFVERMVSRARSGEALRVVSDQVFAPTCASELAVASVALVKAGARRLFHVTNAGTCSWHELAYSVLSCQNYLGAGFPPLRHWRDALPECLPQ
jgi:dTDP-4-dehydrorhamnose reductase